MTRRPAVLTGRASRAVGTLVGHRVRRGRVLAAMRSAVYVETDDESAPVFAVIASDAVRVPVGVVVDATSAEHPFAGLRPGATLTVGDGEVRFDRTVVTVTSMWSPPRPRVDDPDTAVVRAAELQSLIERRALPLPEMLQAPFVGLRRALRRESSAGCEQAATRLIGLGPGLTPSGDDIVCATLVARNALSDHGAGVAGIVAAAGCATGRTTTASAALLRRACVGEAIPPLADLVEAMGSGADLRAPLEALLRVGHHSGSDLARGVATALATAPVAGGERAAATRRSAPTT